MGPFERAKLEDAAVSYLKHLIHPANSRILKKISVSRLRNQSWNYDYSRANKSTMFWSEGASLAKLLPVPMPMGDITRDISMLTGIVPACSAQSVSDKSLAFARP